MNKKQFEDRLNEQYKAIIQGISEHSLVPEEVDYKLDPARKRDAVVAAYWFGVAMAKAMGVTAKMGDTEVKLAGDN